MPIDYNEMTLENGIARLAFWVVIGLFVTLIGLFFGKTDNAS